VLLGLHTGSILYSNVLTDVRVAREAGYDAIEIVIPKLVRYLDAGYRPDDLLAALGPLRPAMINSFLHIERREPEFRRGLLAECERLCAVAQSLSCRVLQVIALNALRGMPWPEMRVCLARSLAELADIAAPFGVTLALEPVTFTPRAAITLACAWTRSTCGPPARRGTRLRRSTRHSSWWRTSATCCRAGARTGATTIAMSCPAMEFCPSRKGSRPFGPRATTDCGRWR
jgi:hypothetical protein